MNEEKTNTTLLAEERTLLAAERTLAAWIRTALSALAGGIAILKLVAFKNEIHALIGHFIGEILLIWGCFVIIIASLDYRRHAKHASIAIKENYINSPIGLMVIILPLIVISLSLIALTLPY